MTLRLAARQAKEEIIDQLRRIIHLLIFPGVDMASRDALMAYIEWMKSNPDLLDVSCTFENFPGTTRAKIIIETSFEPLAPVKRN